MTLINLLENIAILDNLYSSSPGRGVGGRKLFTFVKKDLQAFSGQFLIIFKVVMHTHACSLFLLAYNAQVFGIKSKCKIVNGRRTTVNV